MAGKEKVSAEILIPEGVTGSIEGEKITISGPKGSLIRVFHYPGISITQKDGTIMIKSKITSKAMKAIIGTFRAHLNNMIEGVTKGFEYELKVVYSHFPITVKQSGSMLSIDNFLGEKTPRKSMICGNPKVDIKGGTIRISGSNLEEVSQTAANIELATKVKGRDRRVFQDGIYVTSKGVMSQ